MSSNQGNLPFPFPPFKFTLEQKKVLLRAELEARQEEEEEKQGDIAGEVEVPSKVGGGGRDDVSEEVDGVSEVFGEDIPDGQQSSSTSPQRCAITDLSDDKLKELLSIFLLRPDGVVPGPVRHHLTHLDPPTKITLNHYQWESQRQVGYSEDLLPRYDGSPQIVKHSWSNLATPEDMAHLINGVAERTTYVGQWILPDTLDASTGEPTSHILQERGPFPAKVVHMRLVETTGIRFTVLLQTCKRLRDIGSDVLYSNRLVMNTRGQSPFTHALGVHCHSAFRYERHLIPGLPYADGTPPSFTKTREAIKNMFSGDVESHRFLSRDPITTFFRQIGPANAARVKNLKIEGFMKIMEADQNAKDCPVSLLNLLPVYTAILKHCTPKLERLTIFQATGAEFWSTPATPKSYEERVDAAIEKLVKALPGLKVLELKASTRKVLGQKKCDAIGKTQDEANDPALPWGVTLRWEGIVADRAEKAEVAKRAKDEHKRKVAEREAKAEANAEEAQKNAVEKFTVRGQAWKESKGKSIPGAPFIDKEVPLTKDTTAVEPEEGATQVSPKQPVPTFRKGQRGKPGSRKYKA